MSTRGSLRAGVEEGRVIVNQFVGQFISIDSIRIMTCRNKMVIRALSSGQWRVVWQSEQGKWQWPTFSTLAMLDMCALIHVCASALFA